MTRLLIQSISRRIVFLIIPIIIFVLVTFIPGINMINEVINKGGESYFYIFIPLILLSLAHQPKGWIKHVYVVGLLAIFYGLLLKWFWTTGYSEGATQLWGYLPTSDVISYYQEAYGLLAGNPLNGSATYRPLSTLFFSSLLWISNLNPKICLMIVVYLNVLGSLVASNELYNTHGTIASALYLTAGLLFYKFFAGTMMTEQVGFLLGNLAFASFWNGIKSNCLRKVLLGLFILSLGLNVRAGAMIILITLPFWIGFRFSQGRFSVKWAGIALLVAFSGFALNTLAIKVFTPDNGTMFSNFGFTLYGVAVGNKGWYQIIRDHPGITTAESTQIAIQQILSDPLLFLKGIISTYRDFFDPSTCWAYCYLQLTPTKKNIVVFILFLFGGWYIIKNRKQPFSSFLIFSLIGIFLSIPFAPTRDVGQRSYTITNPILTSMLVMGIALIKKWIIHLRKLSNTVQSNKLEIHDESETIFHYVYLLLTFTIALSLVVPLFTYNFKPLSKAFPLQTCAANEISISFLTNRNAWVHVLSPQDLPEGISIPYATLDTLTKIVYESPYHLKRSFTDSVQFAKPGNSIGYAPFYYRNNSQIPIYNLIMVVVNTTELPKNLGFIQFCGKEVTTIGTESNYIKTFIDINLVLH